MLPAALVGALLLGLGTSRGFPVGLSAAADDPRYSPGRVSTVASIGYVAFLAGPPGVGLLADHIGVLALSITGVLLAVAFMLSPVTAPISPSGPGPSSPPRPGSSSPPDPDLSARPGPDSEQPARARIRPPARTCQPARPRPMSPARPGAG